MALESSGCNGQGSYSYEGYAMAMDISLDTINDEGIVRIWEAVMEQVAKDYVDTYTEYLRYGLEYLSDYRYGHRKITVKARLLELEDYIVGDLIAGPHAEYIVHGLREEAQIRVDKNLNGKKTPKRIMRRFYDG